MTIQKHTSVMEGGMITGTAQFSDDGLHRHQLTRTFQSHRSATRRIFGFCGVNPSIADALIPDHTVTKLIEFTKRHGGTGLIVFNVFSLISTDVFGLSGDFAPNDPHSNYWIERSTRESDILVPMWGNRDKVPKQLRPRFDNVLTTICTSGKPVCVFGWTKSRDPMHPLMLGYARKLIQVLP